MIEPIRPPLPPSPPLMECNTKSDALKLSKNARRNIADQTKEALKKEIRSAALRGEFYISKNMHENLDTTDQDRIVEEFTAKGFDVEYKYSCLGSKITIKWYE